jgi:hypothetical protein
MMMPLSNQIFSIIETPKEAASCKKFCLYGLMRKENAPAGLLFAGAFSDE